MKKLVCAFMFLVVTAGLVITVIRLRSDSNVSETDTADEHMNLVLSKKTIAAGLSYLRQRKTEYEEAAAAGPLPQGVKEEELSVELSDDGTLYGTFAYPETTEEFPCVVFVHDSGAQDRNESIYENTPFRDIAWSLAKEGIASYRYDKRITTSSDTYDVTIDTEIVNEAVEAVNFLSQEPSVKGIYVLGLGLGGHMIPRIAEMTDNAAGFIIMGGFVRPIGDVIKDQYHYIAAMDGQISDDEKNEIAALEYDLTLVESPDTINDGAIILDAPKSYWQSLSDYNCIETAKKITKPVLVMQGQYDRQVPVTDYNLWRGAFGNKGNWSYRYYEGLNHLMMPGSREPVYDEFKASAAVSQTVTGDLAAWIKAK